jgi:hypothetical protein
MKSDPFYVKDSLSSQFDNEDKIRQQKKLEFMEQQRKDYLEYLKMKDNKKTGTPFKITEDAEYHPPIKKLDNRDANLCTNIAKDNQYSREGYQINDWKIPDKYEKNFNENYIRGKNRSGYNIINHQIYDVKELENKRTNPSLREELQQYEKNLKNQFQNLNINDNSPNKYYENNQGQENKNINDINQRNNFINYEKQSQYPNLNQKYQDMEVYQNYERPPQNYQRNEINRNNNDQPNIPPENNYIQQIKEEQDYKNYLEYIKKKELMEKEKEYEEYLRQKEQNLQMQQEKEKEQYTYNNPNSQRLPNFHNFINTAEDYKNKQNSYIDQYAENLEQQRRDLEYKRQQEQKVLTKENMELYAQQQKNNNYKNEISQLPFDRFQEEREEYYSNKKKNVSTYSNLTSMTTTNPSLKNDPNVKPFIDPEKAYENKIKEEKMNKYRRELDEQIRNRPQGAYGKINNDRRMEVPPDPFSRGYNPNKNATNNNQMMFNPITNQPLSDYKSQQEQMQKEREKKINELYNLQERNDKIENKDYIKNKNEQIPMEYNPYKNPYSAYQGHP